MSAQWKPGDVAMVECSDGEWRRATCAATRAFALVWRFPNRVYRDVDNSHARPLVVLDPDDREQVERLAIEYDLAVIRMNEDPDPRDVTPAQRATAMQAALRSLIAPPIKEEPAPWSVAIVGDSTPFTRVAEDHITPPYSACWFGEHPITGERERLTWGELLALGEVQVVGLGVTS